MRRIRVALTVAVVLLVASSARAASLTFENLGTSDITFFNMWIRINGSDFEILSSDYGIKPPADMRYDLDITAANPLQPGETYTTPRIAALPNDGFEFFSLGVGGSGGFTSAASLAPDGTIDNGLAGTMLLPGSVLYAQFPTGNAFPNEYREILKITVNADRTKPPHPVPEPATLTLILTGLAVFARQRRQKAHVSGVSVRHG